jgi:hypothetical protein
MIRFTGYKDFQDGKLNDTQNLAVFLEEVKVMIGELWSGEAYNFKEDIGEDFSKYYSDIFKDADDAIRETYKHMDIEIEILKKWPEVYRTPTGARFWPFPLFVDDREFKERLNAVGLTGPSLKLKLETNRANWEFFNAKRGEKTTWDDDERQDAKTILNLVKSILSSLFHAWGLGEMEKELLDFLTTIFGRQIEVFGR